MGALLHNIPVKLQLYFGRFSLTMLIVKVCTYYNTVFYHNRQYM